jgi:hypothetical protein
MFASRSPPFIKDAQGETDDELDAEGETKEELDAEGETNDDEPFMPAIVD